MKCKHGRPRGMGWCRECSENAKAVSNSSLEEFLADSIDECCDLLDSSAGINYKASNEKLGVEIIINCAPLEEK